MRKNILKGFAIPLCFSMLTACSSSTKTDQNTTLKEANSSKNYKIAMNADIGGINDQAFNQSAWKGLQELQKENSNVKVKYLESSQASDYTTNLEKFVDEKQDLIFAVGYTQVDAAKNVAESNPDSTFILLDSAFDSPIKNAASVVFKAQDAAFLAGYIAGKTTKTNKVGFIGGIDSQVVNSFRYGYEGGVAYAAQELKKEIKVISQYAESFTDQSKAKGIALKQYSDGCDILFHAAGGAGAGVIEAAKEVNKLVIGVDTDQSSLAPNNVLTSALKKTGVAAKLVSKEFIEKGKAAIGGKTFEYGLKEGSVGIPDENKNLDPEVYKATMEIKNKITSGEITPPNDDSSYSQFTSKLKK
jgi:basic membrane protein A